MRAGPALPPGDILARMDRMYRPQALIYDLTRKCYLLGRDRLIDGVEAGPGEIVLEVGCGTGRNLVALGRLYPGVRLHGLDAAALARLLEEELEAAQPYLAEARP